MAVSNPIVDRIRIIPRPNDFLNRNVGSSGEVFYSKESNTLRLYGGDAQGGYEIVTENNLKRNIASQEVASVKYAITVDNPGSGNVYQVDGANSPALSFVVGYTYIFDQSDSTNEFYPNAEGGVANPHPLNFSADDQEGSNGSGTSYNTNVIYILDGAQVSQETYNENGKFNRATERYVQITITNSTPTTLYYYCSNHTGMGNEIAIGMPGAGGGVPSGGASVDVSDTPPVSPEQGNIWFDSNSGQLYVYITDTDSSQWVQPASPAGSTGFGTVVVGADNLLASTNTTLTYTAGSGITITANDTTNTLEFAVDGQLGVDLTAFSVGADDPASGSGGLAYDNTTGVFTYTPPDLSSYLTSINGLNISSLTNDSNYLTSYTETQTLDDVTTLGSTTTNAITVGSITTSGTIESTGVGAPTIESASNIVLDAADAVIVQTGTFRLPGFTTTERGALTPANGDVIYNTSTNRINAYQNSGWINLDDGTAA